jgi:hypothetical protein
MKRFVLGLLLLFAPIVVSAQIPSDINIRTIEAPDTTTFTISWTQVPGYSTYDLIVFSNPRQFVLEQFRVVTGTSWSIKVPRSQLRDSTLLYASVRVAMSPRYGSITYRMPPVGIAALDVKPDSVTLAPGATQQFCAFVVFVDGKVGIRNPEKSLSTCIDQYNTFPLVIRSPSPLQQSIADTVQVTWSVVNGSPAASTVNVASPVKELWVIKP